jgi:hypothetical protein
MQNVCDATDERGIRSGAILLKGGLAVKRGILKFTAGLTEKSAVDKQASFDAGAGREYLAGAKAKYYRGFVHGEITSWQPPRKVRAMHLGIRRRACRLLI